MYIPSTSYIRNFKVLAIFHDCTAWFVSGLAGNPEDRFSRDVAHISHSSRMENIINQLTVHIVGMFSENVLIQSFSLVILMSSLVKPGQIVCCCDGDGAVIGLVMLGLTARSLQRRCVVFLDIKKILI